MNSAIWQCRPKKPVLRRLKCASPIRLAERWRIFNYYYWGPRQYTGESIILLEWSLEDVRYWCGSVDQGPKIGPYYGMGWERYTILICHDLRKPLSEAWPLLKTWN